MLPKSQNHGGLDGIGKYVSFLPRIQGLGQVGSNGLGGRSYSDGVGWRWVAGQRVRRGGERRRTNALSCGLGLRLRERLRLRGKGLGTPLGGWSREPVRTQ